MRVIALKFVPPDHDESLKEALEYGVFALSSSAPWRWFVPLATVSTTVVSRDRLGHVFDQIGMRVQVRLNERSLNKTPFGYLRAPRREGGLVICDLALSRRPMLTLRSLLDEKLREEFETSQRHRMLPPVSTLPLHLLFPRNDAQSLFMDSRKGKREATPLLFQCLTEAPFDAVFPLLPTVTAK